MTADVSTVADGTVTLYGWLMLLVVTDAEFSHTPDEARSVGLAKACVL